jgi:hypothetical protein
VCVFVCVLAVVRELSGVYVEVSVHLAIRIVPVPCVLLNCRDVRVMCFNMHAMVRLT